MRRFRTEPVTAKEQREFWERVFVKFVAANGLPWAGIAAMCDGALKEWRKRFGKDGEK